MAPSIDPPTVAPSFQQNGDHQNPPVDFSDFRLANDVFRLRALDPVQMPLMAFPKSARGIADFEYYAGKDLDRFTDEAAWHYAKANLDVVRKTVAVLSTSLACEI